MRSSGAEFIYFLAQRRGLAQRPGAAARSRSTDQSTLKLNYKAGLCCEHRLVRFLKIPDTPNNIMKKKTWKEFQESKLLWWVNRSLHIFGWAIVIVQEEDGAISDCYPARVAFRGFSEAIEDEGFAGLTQYLAGEAESLCADVGPSQSNDEAWHPLPGAPLRFRLRFVATLRIQLGADSGLPRAGLFVFCFRGFDFDPLCTLQFVPTCAGR